jgi:diguanylate cyclase (GGDEF)-like protein
MNPSADAVYAALSTAQVEALSDAAFATDADGHVVAWNTAAERLVGQPADLAVGQSCAELLGGVDRDGHHVCSRHCPMLQGLLPTRRAAVDWFGRGGWQTSTLGPRWSKVHPDMLIRGADGGRSSVTVIALPAILDGAPALLHLLREAPLAERDPLTGALSRDGFAVRALDEQNRARRTGLSVSLAIVDIDGLKTINDTHGHDHGDRVLVAVTAALRSGRREDLVGRWGGDEFVVLLPETDGVEASRRLSRTLDTLGGQMLVGGRPVTYSAGVVDLDPFEPLASAIAGADEALYRAKNAGRARVFTGRAVPWPVASGLCTDAPAERE